MEDKFSTFPELHQYTRRRDDGDGNGNENTRNNNVHEKNDGGAGVCHSSTDTSELEPKQTKNEPFSMTSCSKNTQAAISISSSFTMNTNILLKSSSSSYAPASVSSSHHQFRSMSIPEVFTSFEKQSSSSSHVYVDINSLDVGVEKASASTSSSQSQKVIPITIKKEKDHSSQSFGSTTTSSSAKSKGKKKVSTSSDHFAESLNENKYENDILVGIEVSKWDNIVGPQCVYLWTEETTSSFYPTNLSPKLCRLVKYVTDHTVDHSGIEGNSVNLTTLRNTICIVRDLNLAYMSVSIRVPLESDLNPSHNYNDHHSSLIPHAVAVLANLSHLQHFLSLRPLILNWLSEFAPKIGVLLCNGQLHNSKINSWCAELCKTVNVLKNCWWSGPESESHHFTRARSETPETNTMNSTPNTTTTTTDYDVCPSKNVIRSSQFWEFLPPRMLNKNALESILTSHLSTSCSSIVIGSDRESVNQVIRFLLCFVSEQDGFCSRYSLPKLPDTYMKGLFIQGLIQGQIGERSLSFNHIISNRYPYTHIEIGSRNKVRQLPLMLHRKYRKLILMQEMAAIWNSTHFSSPNLDPFPNMITEGVQLVSNFIEELLMLPNEKRYARLLFFRRMLHTKAIVLLTYIQSIRNKPKEDRIKKLKKDPMIILGLDEAFEYQIVQIFAEKIRPGTIQMIETGSP